MSIDYNFAIGSGKVTGNTVSTVIAKYSVKWDNSLF